jgi:hypothetical protein|eukprot:scaffold859_cov190-Alexandrium_tamarense.AAC.18
MGLSTESSQNRRDAIETLIDMDPAGAAYRAARTMVSPDLRFSYSCVVLFDLAAAGAAGGGSVFI